MDPITGIIIGGMTKALDKNNSPAWNKAKGMINSAKTIENLRENEEKKE